MPRKSEERVLVGRVDAQPTIQRSKLRLRARNRSEKTSAVLFELLKASIDGPNQLPGVVSPARARGGG